MDIIRGPKPLTEIERAVAAEAYRRLRPEIELAREMNPDLLDYRGSYVQGYTLNAALANQLAELDRRERPKPVYVDVEKCCSKCREMKLAAEFYFSASYGTRDQRSCHCKSCCRTYFRAYGASLRERRRLAK
jgi:hypothetical protein